MSDAQARVLAVLDKPRTAQEVAASTGISAPNAQGVLSRLLALGLASREAAHGTSGRPFRWKDTGRPRFIKPPGKGTMVQGVWLPCLSDQIYEALREPRTTRELAGLFGIAQATANRRLQNLHQQGLVVLLANADGTVRPGRWVRSDRPVSKGRQEKAAPASLEKSLLAVLGVPRTLAEIARLTGMSRQPVTRQLLAMEKAGKVAAKRANRLRHWMATTEGSILSAMGAAAADNEDRVFREVQSPQQVSQISHRLGLSKNAVHDALNKLHARGMVCRVKRAGQRMNRNRFWANMETLPQQGWETLPSPAGEVAQKRRRVLGALDIPRTVTEVSEVTGIRRQTVERLIGALRAEGAIEAAVAGNAQRLPTWKSVPETRSRHEGTRTEAEKRRQEVVARMVLPVLAQPMTTTAVARALGLPFNRTIDLLLEAGDTVTRIPAPSGGCRWVRAGATKQEMQARILSVLRPGVVHDAAGVAEALGEELASVTGVIPLMRASGLMVMLKCRAPLSYLMMLTPAGMAAVANGQALSSLARSTEAAVAFADPRVRLAEILAERGPATIAEATEIDVRVNGGQAKWSGWDGGAMRMSDMSRGRIDLMRCGLIDCGSPGSAHEKHSRSPCTLNAEGQKVAAMLRALRKPPAGIAAPLPKTGFTARQRAAA